VGIAYLDASAFCKLLKPETESMALRHALEQEETWLASEILAVEAGRVALIAGGDTPEHARGELAHVILAPLTETVRAAAASVSPSRLRALDAIHLATALELRTEIDVMYAYDERLNEAAREHGLEVRAPGR
jgi:predicted nucleic acid-binding protein